MPQSASAPLLLQVQKKRRIFAERLPDLTQPYAQRTNRLKQAQTRVAQAVGSLPGARLAAHLRMPTSATTLLRLERAASVSTYTTPRVLGVDDWAFRKGHRYGTILLDLEQHRVVDVLPDRTSQSLVTWLQEHSGVEIVSRDRARTPKERGKAHLKLFKWPTAGI